MDLAREVLRQVKQCQEPQGWAQIRIEGRTSDEISYHVKILGQAGYLEVQDLSAGPSFDWRAISLTWSGHEFLDALGNETVWNRLKAIIRDKGGSIPFEVLQTLAIETAKSHFLAP